MGSLRGNGDPMEGIEDPEKYEFVVDGTTKYNGFYENITNKQEFLELLAKTGCRGNLLNCRVAGADGNRIRQTIEEFKKKATLQHDRDQASQELEKLNTRNINIGGKRARKSKRKSRKSKKKARKSRKSRKSKK